MKISSFQRNIFSLIFLFTLFACNVTRNVKKDEHLLIKNSVYIDKSQCSIKKLDFSADDLKGIIQQKPNKNFLGIIRFGLWINSYASKGKSTKFKRWLDKNFGEEPVIPDSYHIRNSVEQMNLYLENHGFFNSDINTKIKYTRKKARVSYFVKLTEPYRIRQLFYKTQDKELEKIVLDDTINSKVKSGQIYNTSRLEEERNIISETLRNSGYYYFSPEFVFFEIDSALNKHQMDVTINIQQKQIPGDTNSVVPTKVNHKKYTINKISINTDFDPLLSDIAGLKIYIDSSDNKNSQEYKDYFFYYHNKLKINPKTLRNSIFIEPGNLYRLYDEKKTYSHLSGFSLYKYTTINFNKSDRQDTPKNDTANSLDCLINLTRRPVQSFSIETEGTTSGGKLGMAGNFVYQNLNIFRGGEVLTVKLKAGVEWQSGGGEEQSKVLLFFNTFETGAEAQLDFPKFLLPISQDRIPKFLRQRTTIKTGINYQNRSDYERYITNLSFGYNWRKSEFVSHSLIPVEISSVSIFPDSSFIKKIDSLNDPRLKNQYTDHFIMALKYSYIFNNQERNKIKNFCFFRWNFESAGNLLNLIKTTFGANKNEDGFYTVANIPYAQYLRSDIDFRYYFMFNEKSIFVYRVFFGLGIPYGNSIVLPFEKGFYAGGSNGMRGWNYRSLGPGSYKDVSGIYYEKMGDIKLEANLEYRFPVYKFLNGALFTDLGNIWLLNNSENYPGGKFEFSDVLNEIAIDGGLGIRFDFRFFIFRIDGAIPLRDPSYPKDEKWRFKYLQIKKIIWNFGIGYPF